MCGKQLKRAERRIRHAQILPAFTCGKTGNYGMMTAYIGVLGAAFTVGMIFGYGKDEAK